MKKYILYSLILATAWACTKTLEFNDNGVGNLIVLNSIISPDSCVSGSISQSTSILKDNRYGGFIDGAVELYENGTKVSQINSLYGNFRFTDIKPKPGVTYRIVVSSNGKQAEAETTVPDQVSLISVDTATISNEWGGKNLSCNIKFHDSADEDFYRIIITDESMVRFTNFKDSVKTRYFIYQYSNSINSDDPVFKSVYNNFGSDIIDIGPENSYGIFPDDYFQGKDYSIQAQTSDFNRHNGYATDSVNYFNHQVYSRRIIQVQKLSKGYYNYMKYLNLYTYYRDNPFAEPVPVYSNVNGGAGIFASFNDASKFTIEKI